MGGFVSLLPSLITGAAGIFKGITGSGAAKSAAATQAHWAEAVGGGINQAGLNAQNAINRASGEAQTGMATALAGANEYLSPYRTLGETGATGLNAALQPGGGLTQQFSFGVNDLQADPGYQFTMAEGLKALERSASARSGALGGGAVKAALGYSQGLASTEFQNAYNRAANTFQMNRNNMLQGLQTALGYGLPAASTSSGNTMNAAQYIGNTGMDAQRFSGDIGLRTALASGDVYLGGANAKAAGQIGSANAWGNMATGLANSGSQYFNRVPLNPGIQGPTLADAMSALPALYGSGGPYYPKTGA